MENETTDNRHNPRTVGKKEEWAVDELRLDLYSGIKRHIG
jgi:hypothetical protein